MKSGGNNGGAEQTNVGFGSGFGSDGGEGSGNAAPQGNASPQNRVAELPVSSGNSAGLTGARPMSSIRRGIMQNMGAMRHQYDRHVRERPDLSGVITIRFSINEFGQVTSAQMTNSTMNHPEFERFVLDRVRSINFDRIDVQGDITEVTYPFAFTP